MYGICFNEREISKTKNKDLQKYSFLYMVANCGLEQINSEISNENEDTKKITGIMR